MVPRSTQPAEQVARVILDQTGLKGEFDFSIDLDLDDPRPNALDDTLLLTVMREQIGLKVDAAKAAVDYFVIDGAERVAAGNQ